MSAMRGDDRQPDSMFCYVSAEQRDVILRGKLGGDLTLRLGRAETDPSKFAVEVDVGHVTRFLGHAESALKDIVQDGKTVQQRVSIEKGERHWTQANLKVYLFGTDKARYGVQLNITTEACRRCSRKRMHFNLAWSSKPVRLRRHRGSDAQLVLCENSPCESTQPDGGRT